MTRRTFVHMPALAAGAPGQAQGQPQTPGARQAASIEPAAAQHPVHYGGPDDAIHDWPLWPEGGHRTESRSPGARWRDIRSRVLQLAIMRAEPHVDVHGTPE